ncbi:MAG TPA: precorrin-2 C(20)-methyltransferase [Tissierellaceae bacterium]|nr:precorrin-2 C(20)-methyltransferase [Tissierellaceae bacterium]
MKKLYGIGTGPGNADLLTLRSVNIMKEVDIIFAPNNKGKNMALDTASEFIKDKEVVYLDFPMGNVVEKDYEKAANTILDRIPENGKGAFLTIGDPMIYSTFIYIMEELENKEIEIEIVPGIPSFVASAAEAKFPLTIKGDTFILCDEFHEGLLEYGDSISILKTLRNKEKLINTLEENNYQYDYIKKVSLKDQEILKEKDEILKDKNYMSLILTRKEWRDKR